MSNPNNVCDHNADCMHNGWPTCYACRDRMLKAEREQNALLAVTQEAGNYVDAEQAEYYSTPSPRKQHSRGPDSCEDYHHYCVCKACMARENWLWNN